MKSNLFVIILMIISSISFGQINIEIISPDGKHKSLVNDSAHVCLEISIDSTALLIQDDYSIVHYDIGKITLSQSMRLGELHNVIELSIMNDKRKLVKIIMWEKDMKIVEFHYEDGLIVINSGQGITYYW